MILQAALFAAQALSAAAPFVDPIDRCAALLAENDRFAGAVAIGRRGEMLLVRGYPDRASADTPYNIASLGKMFTAVAIGQLVDSGRLGFDDPVGHHLPGLAPDIGRITVAQLLNHSSGLADYFRPENRSAIAAARTARDLLPLALAGGVRFEPGSQRAYSNSGFVVLGAVVETLTGQSYADYVREQIFIPARMSQSSLTAPPGAATPMTRMSPTGPASASGPRHPAPIIDEGRGSPAGGAYSTAGDLVRFADAFMAHRLTRAATTEALIRLVGPSRRDSAGGIRGYGFGFNISEVGGVRFAGHGGGAPGRNAELAFSPDSGTAIAVVSNYDPPAASTIADFARSAIGGPQSPPDPNRCLEPRMGPASGGMPTARP